MESAIVPFSALMERKHNIVKASQGTLNYLSFLWVSAVSFKILIKFAFKKITYLNESFNPEDYK